MVISSNLLALVEKIRVMPGMYLGKRSLVALNHFMGGYSAKEYEIGSDSRIPVVDLRDFEGYIESLYGLNATTKDAFTLIAENTKSDEEAFQRFFELLDDYLDYKVEEL